ncbi:MAG: anthranilate phosphoribosyltransferase [Actinobacteria bacterium]|nr:anthranilate phosphoribosyltransferase [Actinomycetota bacterium]
MTADLSALTHVEAAALMRGILRGEQSPEEIKQFLLTYNAREATPSELGGFLAAVREAATKVDLPSGVAARAIDIVGTGGDNSGSVNVSTMTSLVVAGAGVPVCKHGNRSASSKCGTADVLEALGARIELTPEQVVRCVNVAGFGFIFAQKFHPAFRHVGPVRRELGVPTIFNLLGPMANPAPVAYMLVGVANPARMGTMAAALAQRTTASLVVHGHGGLDELSLAGANRVIATRNGVVQAESTVNASDVGVTSADNGSLRGGDPAHNAQVVRDVLANRLAGPIRDVVVLNAAVALHLAGAAVSLRAGATLADSAISSGAGYAALDAFVAESQRD